MEKTKKLFLDHIGLFILILILFPLLFHNFSYFPNGWDQIEYSWVISSNYLPHSPYIAYIFIGKIFNLFFDAPIALSIISVISGLCSICLFYVINFKLFQTKKQYINSKLLALLSVLLFGLSYLFIQQSTIQELYMFQTMLIMLTIFLLISKIKYKEIYAGITFGFLFAAHNSSIFFIPVILYLFFSFKNKKKSLNIKNWFITSIITCFMFYFLLYLIFPPLNQSQKLIEFILYLRGIAPGIEILNVFNFEFIKNSIFGLFERLFNSELINLGYLHLIFFVIGFVLSYIKNLRFFLFWIIYCLPYLSYEILFGQNLDFGLYVPFLYPTLFVFISYGLVETWNYLLLRYDKKNILNKKYYLKIKINSLIKIVISLFTILIVLMLIFPSYNLMKSHWNDLDNDILNHYSNTTLAAIWLSDNVEKNAVIIQPKDEWNVNIIPYYSNRKHIYHFQEKLMLFEDRGVFTPLNENSFSILTTEKLIDLFNLDIPVYAFDEDPLSGFNEGILEQYKFTWQPVRVIEVDEIRFKILISDKNRDGLSKEDVILYKCFLS